MEHLLVDLPSIDKADDGGELGNHKRFFKYGKTISELLFIENYIDDGFGFLHIQILPLFLPWFHLACQQHDCREYQD